MINQYPTALDKLILTGFTISTASVANLFFAWSFEIAYQQNPARFARYKNDKSYWATESASHDLTAFFDGPNYPTGVFDYFVANKGAFTMGTALTITAPTTKFPVIGFKGEVLALAGQRDLAFCGGDCYQPPSLVNGTSLLADVGAIFPSVSKFSTYIAVRLQAFCSFDALIAHNLNLTPTFFSTQPDTGHAAFQHNSAPTVFSVINNWLVGKYT